MAEKKSGPPTNLVDDPCCTEYMIWTEILVRYYNITIGGMSPGIILGG